MFVPFPVYAPPIPLIIVCGVVLSIICPVGVPKVPPPNPVAAPACSLISTPSTGPLIEAVTFLATPPVAIADV